jgi:chitin synthase
VKGIQSIQADGAIDAQEILDNKVFRNIVLSLAVTYGLYVVSSLLAFDPWHMGEPIRRFGQYSKIG